MFRLRGFLMMLLGLFSMVLFSNPQKADAIDTSTFVLHFTDGVPTFSQSAFELSLSTFIKSATTSLDIAIFNLADNDIINDINTVATTIGAANVRIVTDGDNFPISGLNSGISVVNDGATPSESHNKFVVVDKSKVWTGSANFAQSSFTSQSNLALEVNSASLAANYTAEFDRLFTNGLFHSASSPTVTTSFSIAATSVQNYFSPQDDISTKVTALLSGATKSIYFASFIFGNNSYLNAINARVAAGVSVAGIFDDGSFVKPTNLNAQTSLVNAGVPITNLPFDNSTAIMHHKFIVIDNLITILGSANLTRSASVENDENILVITDADFAKSFVAEINRLTGLNLDNIPAAAPGSSTVSTVTTSSTAAISVIRVKGYPNPMLPSRGIAQMTFAAEPATVNINRIRILNLRGRQIRVLTPLIPTNKVVWDGRVKSGRQVASGVYLYVVETTGGLTQGRFTVVR